VKAAGRAWWWGVILVLGLAGCGGGGFESDCAELGSLVLDTAEVYCQSAPICCHCQCIDLGEMVDIFSPCFCKPYEQLHRVVENGSEKTCVIDMVLISADPETLESCLSDRDACRQQVEAVLQDDCS
jgi:hypothetical protein